MLSTHLSQFIYLTCFKEKKKKTCPKSPTEYQNQNLCQSPSSEADHTLKHAGSWAASRAMTPWVPARPAAGIPWPELRALPRNLRSTFQNSRLSFQMLRSEMEDAADRAQSQGLVLDTASCLLLHRYHSSHHGNAVLIDLPVSDQMRLHLLSGVH